jgi:hypothetical protein
MKKIIVGFIILSFIFHFNAMAQGDTLNVESLKLNSAPAYVILGVEPDNIQRPSSPSQFIGGVQNAVVNGQLKPNFAFEFSPYYLKKPKGKDSIRFRAVEYLLPQKSLFKNIARTTSISIATSQSDTVVFGNLEPGTGLGIGLRCVLVEGKPHSDKVKLLQVWNQVYLKEIILNDLIAAAESIDSIKMLESLISEIATNWKTKIEDSLSQYNLLSQEFVNTFIDDITSDLLQEISFNNSASLATISNYLNGRFEFYKSSEKEILSRINQEKFPFAKTGFMLEFAFGESVVFQNNQWKDITQTKAAIWLTPSYRWEAKTNDKDNFTLIDLLGVLRYTFNNKKDIVDISNYFDAGVKTQILHNRIGFSLEAVYRYATEKPQDVKKNYTYRLVTSFDYKVSDLITFKFSFGTNFNGNISTYSEPKNMFALGGVNFGIFNPAKKN